VAWTGSDAEFQTFIDRHALTFTQLSDDVGAIYERFSIPVQPAVVVVRPDGPVETLFGAFDAAELDRLLNDVLA
jgi:peroxiredoxin